MSTFVRAAAVAAIGAVALAGGAASAVTIEFDGDVNGGVYQEDGFSYEPAILTNGNCPADPSCLLLNPGSTSSVTMTADDGSLFDLLGFSYHFVGDEEQQRGTLTVSNGTSLTFTQADYGNDPFTITDADLGGAFLGVSAITFTMDGPGADRLDNVIAVGGDTTVIPLPASALMLMGAVAGLGFLARRRLAA
jgi:hypothetical protein